MNTNAIIIILFFFAMASLYTGLELSIQEGEEREFHFASAGKKIRTLNLEMKVAYIFSAGLFLAGLLLAHFS